MSGKIWIFDVDGTIIDFFPRHYSIYSDYLDKFKKFPVTYSSYKKSRRAGISDGQILSIYPNINIRSYYKFKSINIEKEKYLALDKPLSGSIKTLTALSNKSTVLLLTSRKKINLLELQVNSFGITKTPEIISSSKKTTKKELKKIINWINKFGTLNDVIYVGDGQDDINVANNLGVRFYGVLSGISNRYRMNSLPKKDIISSINQVLYI